MVQVGLWILADPVAGELAAGALTFFSVADLSTGAGLVASTAVCSVRLDVDTDRVFAADRTKVRGVGGAVALA